MLRKPTKHSIKVFVICCLLTAVLLGLEVHVGKDTGASAVAIAILQHLINEAGLTSVHGCILIYQQLVYLNLSCYNYFQKVLLVVLWNYCSNRKK